MSGRLARGEDPGAFFDRADIEAEQQSPDGRGGYVSGGWEAIPGGSGIPVAIRPLSADERIRAMQAEADVTHEVITRVYVPGVRADNRLRVTTDGGRLLYLVAAPIEVGRRQRLRLLCREREA
ncbi:MAG TPA: phage head closure protein [Longimicrobiales bacterium]